MIFFNMNLYKEGEKKRKNRLIERYLHFLNKVLGVIAIFLFLLVFLFIYRMKRFEKDVNSVYAKLKNEKITMQINDYDKDKIISFLKKEANLSLPGKIVEKILLYKPSALWIDEFSENIDGNTLNFSFSLKNNGVYRYTLDDIKKMMKNMLDDKKEFKIQNLEVEELSVERGISLSVKVEGQVVLF